MGVLHAQELMCQAQEAMSANVELLQHLQARAGLPLSALDDMAVVQPTMATADGRPVLQAL